MVQRSHATSSTTSQPTMQNSHSQPAHHFYRRTLPTSCINFASVEGKKLFTESLLKGQRLNAYKSHHVDIASVRGALASVLLRHVHVHHDPSLPFTAHTGDVRSRQLRHLVCAMNHKRGAWHSSVVLNADC